MDRLLAVGASLLNEELGNQGTQSFTNSVAGILNRLLTVRYYTTEAIMDLLRLFDIQYELLATKVREEIAGLEKK